MLAAPIVLLHEAILVHGAKMASSMTDARRGDGAPTRSPGIHSHTSKIEIQPILLEPTTNGTGRCRQVPALQPVMSAWIEHECDRAVIVTHLLREQCDRLPHDIGVGGTLQ